MNAPRIFRCYGDSVTILLTENAVNKFLRLHLLYCESILPTFFFSDSVFTRKLLFAQHSSSHRNSMFLRLLLSSKWDSICCSWECITSIFIPSANASHMLIENAIAFNHPHPKQRCCGIDYTIQNMTEWCYYAVVWLWLQHPLKNVRDRNRC